jgi:hypothetical protein
LDCNGFPLESFSWTISLIADRHLSTTLGRLTFRRRRSAASSNDVTGASFAMRFTDRGLTPVRLATSSTLWPAALRI